MSKKLGQLVKNARTDKGLTQAAVADRVDGLTASDLSKIERGEKEPSQEVLRQMARVLGVTQKSLLEAATGKSSAGAAAGKTSSGKSSGKTGSAKTGSAKTGSAKKAADSLTLTAAEKKLVQAYRKADSGARKAAMNLLSGNGNILELIPVLMSGSQESGQGSSQQNAATELLNTLLSGKTGSSGNEMLGTLLQTLLKK